MKHLRTTLCLLATSLIPAARVSADAFLDVSNGMDTIHTIAGQHVAVTKDAFGNAFNQWQSSFEGARGTSMILSNPHMAAADAFGNIYVADKASHSVLIIYPDHTVHTYAGTHTAGFNGDGPAPATSLQLNNTNGLYVLPDGTLYLLDPGNHRIRKVDRNGIMTTIVNDPEPNWYPSGRGLWVSPDEQTIYYTNEFAPVPPSIIADGAVVKKWTAAGGIQVIQAKSMGWRNPANLAVNPLDGKLYVTDRAEEDTTKIEQGLWRIDGVNLRTRITGNGTQAFPFDGQLALNSFIEEPRGLAFLPNGSYFLCGHKDGNVWYIDTTGHIHKYIAGFAKKDVYSVPDGAHPPLASVQVITQPRAITLAPNGALIGVCNDSGFIWVVSASMNPAFPPLMPVSVPASLTSALLPAHTLRLTWPSTLMQTVVIERSTDLDPGNWAPISASRATAATTTFTDPDAPSFTRAFYRLVPPFAP